MARGRTVCHVLPICPFDGVYSALIASLPEASLPQPSQDAPSRPTAPEVGRSQRGALTLTIFASSILFLALLTWLGGSSGAATASAVGAASGGPEGSSAALSATASPTALPSATSLPTVTPTSTGTPSATATRTPSATATATPSATPTPGPTATATSPAQAEIDAALARIATEQASTREPHLSLAGSPEPAAAQPPASQPAATAVLTLEATPEVTTSPAPEPAGATTAEPATAEPSAMNTPEAATPEPSPTLAPEPTSPPSPTAAPAASQWPRLVLGNYFVWYDSSSWDGCNISNGDRPLQPYSSDDAGAIARQVHMAIGAGLDGFTSHWFAPGERTDQNFAKLLAASQGTGFQSTVMFLRHIWPGSPAPSEQNVAEALSYIMNTYSGSPNFLHVQGKPVIFFTDVYRVPQAGEGAVQAWANIRAQVDPGYNAIWIAEGLDPSYLAVFDGLYVYKVTHAAYPNDYLKDSRWAAQVRQWAQNTGRPKLWIATIVPGYDDLRAGCKPDVRVPSQPHKQDRQDGAFYQATFDAAMQSNPDWLFVQSFNEWVEGTYIEPSVQYGDKYLSLTGALAQQFKGGH